MYIIVRLFRHLDKKLSFYFMFFFFLVPFKIFAKSVDGWTSSVYSEEKNHTSCISLFKSVDMWTRSCFSISCFFSFLYPPKCFAKSVDRWTSSENSKHFNENCMYFNIQKCGYVDKKLSFYFNFSFILVPFKIFAKSVDTWTSSEFSEKIIQLHVIHFSKVWICGQEAVFLFHVFFLSCALYLFCKKCGQVDEL
jgi:hypothetical protein